MKPIRDYLKTIKEPITEYVGIAKDEHKRLERYKSLETENHKFVTLADLEMTELQALDLCKKYNLLSPIYNTSFRGGCWFCPKQSMNQFKNLYLNYPDLWQKLKDLEKDSFNTFKPNLSLVLLEKKFKEEE